MNSDSSYVECIVDDLGHVPYEPTGPLHSYFPSALVASISLFIYATGAMEPVGEVEGVVGKSVSGTSCHLLRAPPLILSSYTRQPIRQLYIYIYIYTHIYIDICTHICGRVYVSNHKDMPHTLLFLFSLSSL